MRVAIRPLGDEDLEPIEKALIEAETSEWLPSVPWPYRSREASGFLLQLARGCDQAITVDGVFAGIVRCVGEPGYWLVPEYRRQGAATQAMVMVLQNRFAEGASRIEASHLVGNDASRAVYLRLGFTDIGEDGGRQLMELTPEAFAACEALQRMPELRVVTRRCVMDRLMPEDLPAIHSIVTHPDIAPMLMRFRTDQSVDELGAMLEEDMKPEGRPLRLAVRMGGRCVGTIGLDDGPDPQIFYSLAPEVSGQGIASEIVPAFCAASERRFGLDVLTAHVFADNPASCRVLEKSGFKQMGSLLLVSAARQAPVEGWLMQRG